MINPINGHEITKKKRVEFITQAREARANARRAMRSGNPAKRAEAAKVYIGAPGLIRQSYIDDHRERHGRR